MTVGPLTAVVRYLRRLSPSETHDTDAALLRRFADTRDDIAFTELVRRHGPLVLNVCRQVTGNAHLAEDAFQATFLVLARKAGSIRKHGALAAWLHRVAYRVALRARADFRSGVPLDEEDFAMTSGRATRLDSDVRSVLHEEVSRLPEKYRSPIVLCYLEGRTNEETAQKLRWPLGTVKGRLDRARKVLHRRLSRRGIGLGAAMLTTAIAGDACAAVPQTLADATIGGARLFAAGQAVAGLIPMRAAALAEGVLRTMCATKVRLFAFLAVCSLLAAGMALAYPARRPAAGDNTVETAHVPAPEPAKDKKPTAKEPRTVPLTVAGQATDASGKPVVRAEIYLVSTNGSDKVLGMVRTDAEGRYRFADAPLPVREPQVAGWRAQGTLQVFGAMPGYGFAWHGMRAYNPEPRPADLNPAGGEDYSYFTGEKITMDLHFGPAAVLKGRVVDEDGKPVPGVKVSVQSCDLLDTAGREKHVNYREFWALYLAPETWRVATTDKDGRYRLNGLPAEAVFWVGFEHPTYARDSRYFATTAKPLPAQIDKVSHGRDEPRPDIATGELNLTVAVPRRVDLRVVAADTGKPAAAIRLGANTAQATGPSAHGTTDTDGRLTLRLPPGEYSIMADPPRDSPFIRTLSKLTVARTPDRQSLELRIRLGCILILEAMDATTGKGVPGVRFTYEMDEQPGSWTTVQSSTVYVDHPVTDADGRLKVVVYPGKRRYGLTGVALPEGYEVAGPSEQEVVLPEGKTVTAQFKLRQK